MGLETILHIALAVIGLVLLYAFVRQFSPRAALYAVPVVGAVLGFSIIRTYRRRKLSEQFARREEELKRMEKRLAELREDYAASEQAVLEAQEMLERERRSYLIEMKRIEAESREALEAEIERIDHLSTSELLDEISTYLDALEENPPPAEGALTLQE